MCWALSIAKEMLGVEGEVTKSERNKAKRIVYALCYGMGVQSLARTLEIRTTEATQLREKFLGKFPGVQKFLNGCKEESRKTGYTATFISGRRRYLPDITSAHDPQQRDHDAGPGRQRPRRAAHRGWQLS